MSDSTVIGLMVAAFLLLLLAGHYIHSLLMVAGIGGLVLLDGMDNLTGLLGPQPFARTAAYTLTTIRPPRFRTSTKQSTPDASGCASITSSAATPRANQGVLSSRYRSPSTGSAQSPSDSAGGHPSWSCARANRPFTGVLTDAYCPKAESTAHGHDRAHCGSGRSVGLVIPVRITSACELCR